jgi:MFS transporter, FHS family, glucose/mannose:H+ symporter
LGTVVERVEAKDPASRSGAISPSLFAAMVLAGIATTMVGPLLPRLESRWQIGDAAAGLLFTALFLASVATGALVGPLALRFGYLPLVRSGMMLSSLGTAMLAMSPWPLAIGAVAMVGCGLGLSVPAANLGVAGTRAVMLVNFAWSIGAVGGPLLLAFFPDAFLWSLSVAMAFASVGRFGAPTRVAEAGGDVKPVMSKATALAATFVFLYVGVESSLDGWLSSYASRSPETRHLWAALPSVFWIGILIGRFLATLALPRLAPASLLGSCLVVAFSSICLLLGASQPWAILAATALTGLGLAPIFPLAVSSYSESAKGEKSAGLIFSAGGLGGASIPALVGSVSEAFGDLRFAMAIPPALIVMMLFLWWTSGTGKPAVEVPRESVRPNL